MRYKRWCLHIGKITTQIPNLCHLLWKTKKQFYHSQSKGTAMSLLIQLSSTNLKPSHPMMHSFRERTRLLQRMEINYNRVHPNWPIWSCTSQCVNHNSMFLIPWESYKTYQMEKQSNHNTMVNSSKNSSIALIYITPK